MALDFYAGMSEDTADRIKRMQPYIDLALQQGDTVMQDKPYELRIIVKKKASHEPADKQ
jgi:hypothetical protein